MLAKTILADCNQWDHLDKYQRIYDNAECIDFFDDDFFGEEDKEKILRPHSAGMVYDEDLDEDVEVFGSKTIQDFTSNLAIALEKPTIYILDSFDSLADQEEIDKMREKVKAAKKKGKASKKIAGSYGAGRAKGASELFRNLVGPLQETGSFLLIISQTRENIGSTFIKKTRNGGKALDFYACHIGWLHVADRIKKKYRAREVEVGQIVRLKCTKNKCTGNKRLAEFNILNSYGIDSIESGVRCLIDLGIWKSTAKKVETPWGEMLRSKLVGYIEEHDYEDDFADFIEEAWQEFEEHIKPKRKKKYK